MKQRYPALLIDLGALTGADLLKDLGDVVRFINMSVHSRGFRANKGLTNDFFLKNKKFVWRFESKEKRNRALTRLTGILSKKVLCVMKVITSMSSSRAARCPSLRPPKMSASLQAQWQRRVAQFSTPSRLTVTFKERVSDGQKMAGHD